MAPRTPKAATTPHRTRRRLSRSGRRRDGFSAQNRRPAYPSMVAQAILTRSQTGSRPKRMLWLWNRDSIPPMISDPTIDTVATWLATTPARASRAENGIRKRLRRGFRNVSDVAARKPAQRRSAATTRCGKMMVCGVMDRVFTLGEIFKWISVAQKRPVRTPRLVAA
jgi:hypothetical protein